jgi:hypothetical protein
LSKWIVYFAVDAFSLVTTFFLLTLGISNL